MRRKRDGQRLCRRYLGCDRSLALEFALVPVKGLLSAVLEVGAIMVLRQAVLAHMSIGYKARVTALTDPQNWRRQCGHSPTMRKAAELHCESEPMWNWQRFLAGILKGGCDPMRTGGKLERNNGGDGRLAVDHHRDWIYM